jgi:hypothetical protein
MIDQYLSPRIAIGFHLLTDQQLAKCAGALPSIGGFKGQSFGLGPRILWRPPFLGDRVTLMAGWIRDLSAKGRLEPDYGSVQIVLTP